LKVSIVDAVAQIKRSVAEALSADSIEAACRTVQHSWRQRELDPPKTVWTFLTQVLHGNTACEHAVTLSGLSCSASAYCQARSRLPLGVWEQLLEETTQMARSSLRAPLWHGHRTFWIDGSSTSMSDTPELQDYFGQPGGQQTGCGFPVAKLWGMFDARSGLLVKLLVSPLRTHEGSQAARFHSDLRAGDVVVGDRAFASYAHLALLSQRKLHGLFRVHQRQLVSFRKDRKLTGKKPRGTVALYATSRLIRKLGKYDQVVEYQKPKTRPTWMSAEEFAALPASIIVRELRFRTKMKGCRTREITLVTTLTDPERYPDTELIALYRTRWEVETNFAHLKTTMQMDVLRCQTVDGVLKELHVFALVYNLTRLVMLSAARTQRVPVARVSFVAALRWLACPTPQGTPVILPLNPLRPIRYEPRVRKRRPKQYPLMKVPRRKLRQQLTSKQLRT
jgi:hypothetical protein